MRWNIKGFDQYEVDEAGQVWAKPQKRRFGNSCRLIPEKPLTWIFNKAAPLNGGSRFFSYQTTPHDANRCAENTSMKTPANLDL